MEPVDKIKARTEALEVLGLDQFANSDDIRDAWRRVAFHAHPDHTGGDYGNFARAKSAYDLLRQEGLAGKGPCGSDARMPRRPKLKKRVIELPSEDIEACRALLSPERALSQLPDTRGESATDMRPAISDHVPDAVGCYGRHLTYFVPTPVSEGANRVALPTSVLTSSRNMETEVLSFESKDTGAGEVIIPETIRIRKFPGAKSVRIRFDADRQIRDEFWLAS